MSSLIEDLKQPMDTFLVGAKAAFTDHLNDIVRLRLETRMEQGAALIRKSLQSDPDTPRFVMEGMELLFDSMWRDVRTNLVDYIMVGFGKATGKYLPVGTPPDSTAASPSVLGRARAWLLYTWLPSDLSFWAQLRNPGYWGLMALAYCPRYGVGALCWLLLGGLIERRDKYQLTTYILGFKGYMFLSTGLYGVVIMASVEAYCVGFSPIEAMYDCRASTPGQRPEYVWETFCFAAEVLAVYVAFLQLPRSTSDAALKTRFSSPECGAYTLYLLAYTFSSPECSPIP